MLQGRRNQCEVLDRQLQRLRAGESSVLVVRGEAGVGKTALLEYVAERAAGCRAIRIRIPIGAEAFAERARRELLATGETAPRRTVETRDVLTPQEAQIARMASDRQTNPEIGAKLYQPAHRRVPPAQGVHQARHQLPQAATRRACGNVRRRRCHNSLALPQGRAGSAAHSHS